MIIIRFIKVIDIDAPQKNICVSLPRKKVSQLYKGLKNILFYCKFIFFILIFECISKIKDNSFGTLRGKKNKAQIFNKISIS